MNQIKAGAILNYVIIGLNTLVGLAYTPYLLRCLGQNEYGLYSMVSSVIAYLTILDFGFGNAIIRYTAKLRAENKYDEQWQMFGMFIIVYLIIGLIAFCCGLALYVNVDRLFDQTMTESDLYQARIMMLLLTINLGITFPLSIFGSIISAYENFIFQRVVNIFRIVLCTLVMIVLLTLGYKAIALVVVNTIFNILTLIINIIYCRKNLNIRIKFERFNISFFKEISTYSLWIFLNAIMDKIYWGTGQFVLGAISGTIAVAIFSVAIMLQQMYMMFSTSISSVLLPKITAMVALGDSHTEISEIFIKTGRIQCIIMSFILSGFVVFGKGFIWLWAGPGYETSYIITVIFLGSLFVPLIQNVGISILQARNQMKFRSILYLVLSLISLIMQVYMSYKYSALGCSIAIGLTLLLGQGILMNIYYYKKQYIDIPRFWKEILQMLILPGIITIIGYSLSYHIDYTHFRTLLIGIGVFSFVYILIIWHFSINNLERRLFTSIIKKITQK